MTLREQKLISTLILNYLKSLRYVNAVGVHTLAAYELDLVQAFNLKKFSKTHPTLETKTITRPLTFEPELLKSAKKALRQWAHLAPASRQRKASSLRGFLSWLETEGFTSSPHHDSIPLAKVPHKLPHFISVDEALGVLSKLKEQLEMPEGIEKRRARLALGLFLLLYGGGLRVSEACNARWKDLTLENHRLRVRGKGGSERQITLPNLVVANLTSWEPKLTYILEDKDRPLSPRKAYNLIRQAGIRAGLQAPLHPHALRHSYATHLLTSGADLRSIQELLGHRTLQTTQKYTHLGIDHLGRMLASFHPIEKVEKKEKD